MFIKNDCWNNLCSFVVYSFYCNCCPKAECYCFIIAYNSVASVCNNPVGEVISGCSVGHEVSVFTLFNTCRSFIVSVKEICTVFCFFNIIERNSVCCGIYFRSIFNTPLIEDMSCESCINSVFCISKGCSFCYLFASKKCFVLIEEVYKHQIVSSNFLIKYCDKSGICVCNKGIVFCTAYVLTCLISPV